MTIAEIKEAARSSKVLNRQELSDKIRELKDKEVSFLGCLHLLNIINKFQL